MIDPRGFVWSGGGNREATAHIRTNVIFSQKNVTTATPITALHVKHTCPPNIAKMSTDKLMGQIEDLIMKTEMLLNTWLSQQILGSIPGYKGTVYQCQGQKSSRFADVSNYDKDMAQVNIVIDMKQY